MDKENADSNSPQLTRRSSTSRIKVLSKLKRRASLKQTSILSPKRSSQTTEEVPKLRTLVPPAPIPQNKRSLTPKKKSTEPADTITLSASRNVLSQSMPNFAEAIEQAVRNSPTLSRSSSLYDFPTETKKKIVIIHSISFSEFSSLF